jgi:hypothetical protein
MNTDLDSDRISDQTQTRKSVSDTDYEIRLRLKNIRLKNKLVTHNQIQTRNSDSH